MERTFPPLTTSQKQLLEKGIQLFNAGQFFDCHEVLEEAWVEASGEQKIFLQGLIQAAVSLHHLKRKNLVGARRLLDAGIQKLGNFTPHQESLDVANLLEHLGRLQSQIDSGELADDWQPPQIRFGE